MSFLAISLMLALLCSGFGAQWRAAQAQKAAPDMPPGTFPGTGVGAIPDSPGGTPPVYGTPLVISFNVTGVNAPLTSVALSMTLTHSWVGDLDVVLRAPGAGSQGHVIFSRVGALTATSFGSSSDLNGTYTFTDTASGTNFWTAAAATPVPPGSYRTTAPGPVATSPAPVTSLNTTFGGLTPAQANGTWTLTIRDGGGGDTGSVTAAALIVDPVGPPVTPQHVRDFDNDGKTDFGVFRPSQNVWYVLRSSDNMLQAMQFGTQGDVLVPADYDGDLKTDIAVFRNGIWYIQQTTSGFRAVQFGQDGDIAVPADYDGDGKADIAVWRAGPPFGSFFYIHQSSNNTLRVDTFGQTGDKPVPGDWDGDGKVDVAVYRDGTQANPQSFWYYRPSSGGSSGEIIGIQWGQDGDTAVPGDYDGDAKIDAAVFRPTTATWYLRNSNSPGSPVAQRWGIQTDQVVQGDYDGDGKTDIAVWRASNGTFFTIDSSTGQPRIIGPNGANKVQPFGDSGDKALAYVPEQ
ncbi:MAG: VCBS repeat-containing protein [Acidobacteria bacterium]|nr:VCBS repeat-containing protein [Acidobacteriota bacterium]